MTTKIVNRRDRLSRVSYILQLATIIAEEEGIDDNTAYDLAEHELDAIVDTEVAWSEPQAVTSLRLLPTAWGIVLVRNRSRIVLTSADIPVVLETLTRWDSLTQ